MDEIKNTAAVPEPETEGPEAAEDLPEARKQMLLGLLSDKRFHPMRFRELAGLLQIPRSERNELAVLLDELIREGSVCTDEAGRYLPGKASVLEGEFLATGKGFAFVRPAEGEDIFIPESKTLGAWHKDRVLVTITAEAGIAHGKETRREGMVTKILERGLKEVVGIYRQNQNFGFVIPDLLKLDFDVYIAKEHSKGAVGGQKVVAEITDYGRSGRNPEGRVTQILGHVNDPGVDILSVVKAYELPTEFSEQVLAAAEAAGSEVRSEETEGRLDLRDVPTVTIDGEDAKDLDDAVTLQKQGEHYLLGVHIADVSHYVREHSPLDKEAWKRGTSVYLTDRVIPMLPHALSNGICSMNQGQDRLALSCLMELSERGELIGHRIAETVVRVDHRMSYTQVNGILTGEDAEALAAYADFVPQFRLMAELSEKLRTRRRERGSIDFDFPESKITLDERGRVTDIKPYERNQATKLIEDFMLLANETVAEQFYWLELPFVYRTHETPDPEKMQKLNIFIQNFGYGLHLSREEIHAKELQKLLARIEGTPEEALISRLTLRSMKQARYTTECTGHFGLASKYYCHFTSPIRRYPDLQIHRIIKEYLHGELTDERVRHYRSILEDTCRQASGTERRAEEAERDVEKMKKVEYMRKFLGESFTGVISGVTGWGLYVELPNTVEGMIRMADLSDDYYRYDEASQSLLGERTGKKYCLGQPITVVVANTDKLARTIDFVPSIS